MSETTHLEESTQNGVIEYIRCVIIQIGKILADHRIILTISALYCAALFISITFFKLETVANFTLYAGMGITLLLLSIGCFLVFFCIQVQLSDRPQRLFPHVAALLRRDVLTVDRLTSGAITIALFFLLLLVFSNFKRMIPYINFFHLDPFFHELDMTIHFGVDPWRILHPLIGFPIVTFVINFLYNIWLFVVVMVFYWQAFATNNPALRQQYIISFMLCWILIGTAAATLLSSAGPCYYGAFVPGPDVYGPLMSYLHEANVSYPIWALDVQRILYENYAANSTSMATGITAMPSMHVSIAWLMVLLGRRTTPILSRIAMIYFASIFIGSIHLGWHYAVDGYASIILTSTIWYGVGALLTRQQTKQLLPTVCGPR